VHVCNLCFLLVTHENALIVCERLIADASHIPFTLMPNSTTDCFGRKNSIDRPPLLQDRLIQWRLLVYCTQIKDIGSNLLTRNCDYELKFKMIDLSETIFHFNQKDFNRIRKSKTGKYSASPTPRMKKVYSSDFRGAMSTLMQMRVNQMRVNYFFTLDKNIESFISNLRINFSLFKDKTLIATGGCNPLNGFTLYQLKEISAQVHTIRVFLFTNDMKSLELDIKVGICTDNEVDTTTFSIHKMKDFQIYYPENYYYNAYTFPTEWMQLFDNNYSEMDEGKFDGNYRSNLTKREFDPNMYLSSILKKIKMSSPQENNKYEKEAVSFIAFSLPGTPTKRNLIAKHMSLAINSTPKSVHTNQFLSDKDFPAISVTKQSNKDVVFNCESHLKKEKENKDIIRTRPLTSRSNKHPFVQSRPLTSHRIIRPILIQNETSKASKLAHPNKFDMLLIYGDVKKAIQKTQRSTRSSTAPRVYKIDESHSNNKMSILKEKHRNLMKLKEEALKDRESFRRLNMIRPYLI